MVHGKLWCTNRSQSYSRTLSCSIGDKTSSVVGVDAGGILGKPEPVNEEDPLASPELDASSDDDEEGLEPLSVTLCGQEELCSYHW